jgi:electron transfer flavoprotein beta subunit
MHIVVCVKQVPDPEAAFSMLKVDEQAKKVVPAAGLRLVMSPFDEQALEAALRVREAVGEVKITAISVGPESARNVLKHALAMGADEALLVCDPALEDCAGETAALALASAIRGLAPVDLVLAGRQAADSDAGVAGCGIAELMGLPLITFARRVVVTGETLHVERVLADGFETLETTLPAMVTVSNELGAARAPSLRETMRAARKPFTMKAASDVGLAIGDIERMAARRVRTRLFVPAKTVQCELVSGVDEAAQAAMLARRLREQRLV